MRVTPWTAAGMYAVRCKRPLIPRSLFLLRLGRFQGMLGAQLPAFAPAPEHPTSNCAAGRHFVQSSPVQSFCEIPALVSLLCYAACLWLSSLGVACSGNGAEYLCAQTAVPACQWNFINCSVSDVQAVTVAQGTRDAPLPVRAQLIFSSIPAQADVAAGGSPTSLDSCGAGSGGRSVANDGAERLPADTCVQVSGIHAQASGQNPPAEVAAQVRGSPMQGRLRL